MVSIIVPCYNSSNYINELIDSVLLQTYTDFELILIDDASSDDTLQILEKYRCIDERISVIHHDINKGLSEARNTGLQLSHGEYILFLDHDDVVFSDMLEDMLNNAENAEMVCSGAVNRNNKLIYKEMSAEREKCSPEIVKYNNKEALEMYFSKNNSLFLGALWGTLFSRDFIMRMYPEICLDKDILPITYFEDIHLIYRFFHSANYVIFLKKVYVLHRISETNLSRELKLSSYAYEVMEAGKIQLDYLENNQEFEYVRKALPGFFHVMMKLWWQVDYYEKDYKKKILVISKIDKYFEQYEQKYKINKIPMDFLSKISVNLFRKSHFLWKVLIGNPWFLIKYRTDK